MTLRILHCPTDVGGNAWTLSRAERKLGLDSTVMVYRKSWLDYPVDIDLRLEGKSRLLKALSMFSFFIRALPEYDVFHFNFGSSLLPTHPLHYIDSFDLPILRRFGKGIVVTYQGSDARQKTYHVQNFSGSPYTELDCYSRHSDGKRDALKISRIKKFGRYADKIFALNPDLLYVLPEEAEFLPYACVDLEKYKPFCKPVKKDSHFYILHAPTNRGLKGSEYIIEAVERLRYTYDDVELLLVEGIPHDHALELYKKADLVVDQLLIGWYGGLAVEAMALGKPVVCYIREEDLKFIPTEMRQDLPIINANPKNIYEVLMKLVEGRDGLPLLGEQSRAYVEKWHDPMKVASRTKEVYESICV